MANNPNRIEFYQVRDFGEVLTVTFDFVRENFKPLMKGWLYIAGPFALASAFISIYSMNMSPSFSQFFSRWSLINLILGVLTYFLTYLVTLGYLHIYLHEKSPVQLNDLWQFTKQNFWFFTGQYVVLIIVILVGFILLILPGLYLIIVLSIAPIIRIMERRAIFDSISRARQLMSGFWLKTFGLTIVLFIILLVLGGLLQAPSIVLTFLWTFNNIEAGSFSGNPTDNYPLLAVVAAIGQALAVSVNMIPMVAYSLQYFNLRERKEAVSLMDKVASLGKDEE